MKTIIRRCGLVGLLGLPWASGTASGQQAEVGIFRLSASNAVRITGISTSGMVRWEGQKPGDLTRVEVKEGADPSGAWRTYTEVWLADRSGHVQAWNQATPAGYAFVPAGSFLVGSPPDEPGRGFDESQHHAVLSRDLFMQRTEVTKRQMADVMNWALAAGLVAADAASVRLAGFGQQELLDLDDADCLLGWDGEQLTVVPGRDDYPCMEVTWFGAVAYCNFLSAIEGLEPAVNLATWTLDLDASGYRLPTEAEWEYACRAGTTTAFHSGPVTSLEAGSLDPNLDRAGWYQSNSWNPDNIQHDGKGCHPVGQKEPNDWGLLDMHGNVQEWCWDEYHLDLVPSARSANKGVPVYRNARGGHWGYLAAACRSAARYQFEPEMSNGHLGFRPVRQVMP